MVTEMIFLLFGFFFSLKIHYVFQPALDIHIQLLLMPFSTSRGRLILFREAKTGRACIYTNAVKACISPSD